MMPNNEYHIPALLPECLEGLNLKPDGVYADLTFGGGGHSRAILEELNDAGVLLAFDQDPEVQSHLPTQENFIFIPQNFRYLKRFLRLNGYVKVDGVLADLGVSFHQFDAEKRGFSIRFEGPLDMRMDRNAPMDAKTLLNTYDADDLVLMFKNYGEIKGSYKLVRRIVEQRSKAPLESTMDLVQLCKGLYAPNKEKQFLAKVFQAVRIEVNEEMKVLEEMLEQLSAVVDKGGRIVIISYHSLEDRLVKNFIRSGNIHGKIEKDIYGNYERPFKEVNRKVIVPSEEEIERNPRSRSAKLRIAERI